MGYVYSLTCTGCNYETDLTLGPTLYHFNHEGKINDSLKSDLGLYYCRDCENFEIIFLGKANKSWELEDLEKNLIKLQTKQKSTNSLKFITLIYLYFKIQKSINEIEKEQIKIKYKENSIFWELANVQPKCLTCQGDNIDFENGKFKSFPEQTNTKHKCGGFLKLRRTIHFQQRTPDEVTYDINGLVLHRSNTD
jgi:hypothetical protein